MIYFQPLDQVGIQEIHHRGLAILERVGIELDAKEIAAVLVESGCVHRHGRTTIPSSVVDKALAQIPRRFTLYDRDGRRAFEVGDGKTRVQPVGGAPFVVDPETGKHRHASLTDLENLVALADGLDHIDLITTCVTPVDVNPAVQSFAGLAATLTHSSKPVSAPGPESASQVRWFVRLVEAATGSADVTCAPCLMVSILPRSPLTFPPGIVGAIVETARLGLPLSVVPLPVIGLSTPMAMAGALAQQHAENLAAVVIAQLMRPGLPVVYHGRLSVGNMYTGSSEWGVIEVGLMGAVAVELGRLCGIPTNVYGLATSARTPDLQSGWERMANALLPVLGGPDLLGGAGSLGNIMAVSPLQLVVDDEIVASVSRLVAGLSLSEDQFPLKVTEAVMNSGRGTFIGEHHTVRRLKAEGQSLGDLADHSPYGMPGEDVLEHAKAQMQSILREAGERITREAQSDIQEVLTAIEQEAAAQ